MSEYTEFEKQREGAMILLDSDEVDCFQLFAATDEGPITLSAARESATPQYDVFLGQLIRILAASSDQTVEEVAQMGIERAHMLEESPAPE